MNSIKTFEEYWNSVKPDVDLQDKTSVQIVAAQKSAAKSGWMGAMEQVRRFIQLRTED